MKIKKACLFTMQQGRQRCRRQGRRRVKHLQQKEKKHGKPTPIPTSPTFYTLKKSKPTGHAKVYRRRKK